MQKINLQDPHGESMSGDAITREIYERQVRELQTLRALYSKAREIIATMESGGMRAAKPYIEQFRKLDPWQ